MIDAFTLKECKKNKDVLELKIKNLEFAIDKSEKMITESQMDQETLKFLRRKLAQSKQDLEILYLIKYEQ